MPLSESVSNHFGGNWIVRYGLAVLVVALATLVRILLRPVIPTGFPFLTFFLAVMVAAWRGGLGPGLLASVLSTLAADFFFIEAIYDLLFTSNYYWVSLSIFVAESLSITLITNHIKRVQEKLRESEARFRTMLETDAVGIIFLDHSGTVINANDVFLRQTGYSREQIDCRTLHWRSLCPPEWVEASEREMAEFARTGRIGPSEKECLLADGSCRWMLYAGRDLGDGTIAEYCIDINDRKAAQLKLEHFSEELERQVTTRTAELLESQQQLRALATELNLAEQRERNRLAIELHDHLQQMLVVGKLTVGQGKKAANGLPAHETVLTQLDEIFSNALTYSRTLVAELSPPILRNHGLATSFQWLGEYLRIKHGHAVTVFVPDQELNLPEDQRVLVFQSVRELLINAAKHANTGQSTLTMEQHADHVRISVRDDGKGFDPAVIVPVSAGDSLSSKFGLFSIRERMRALGGTFEIQSTPGQGTKATLILPLVRSVIDCGEAPSDSTFLSEGCQVEVVPDDCTLIRVLIVDDHAMIRQGLRSMLETYLDIQVVGEAANGEEAITLAHTFQPDVVLMDINMPQKNGIEATTVIKQACPHMAIVGLSVNADGGHREAMIQAGAAALLTKETAAADLYHAIFQALQTTPLGNRPNGYDLVQ